MCPLPGVLIHRGSCHSAMWSPKEWVLDIVCVGSRDCWGCPEPWLALLVHSHHLVSLSSLLSGEVQDGLGKGLNRPHSCKSLLNKHCPVPLCSHELSREQRGALQCQGPGALGKAGREPGLEVLCSPQVAGGSCKKQHSHNWELTQKAEAFSAKASNY